MTDTNNNPEPTDLPDGEVHVTTDGRKVSWGYVRKQGLPNYSSEEVSIFISDLCPENEPNVLAWAAVATPLVVPARKAHVWEALGLSFSFDANGHIKLDDPQPGVTNSSGVAQPQPQPQPQPQSAPYPVAYPPPQAVRPGGPPAQPHPRRAPDKAAMAQYGVHAEYPQFCKGCGGTEFYDNRAEGDEALLAGKKLGPDWKCKNPSCPRPRVYRPGSFPYNEALKGGGPPPGVSTAPPQQMVPQAPSPPHPFPPMHLPPDEGPPPEPPPEE